MSASGSTPGVFSSSLRPRTSASSPARACSSLSRWRGSSWSTIGSLAGSALASAPRQSRLALPPHGPAPVSLTVVSRVRKKLSVFIAATLSVPPTGSGRRGARVRRRVVGGAGREDSVQAEVEAEDPDRVLDVVAATEPVREREVLPVRMSEDRRVLGALVVVERDPAEAVRERARVRRRARLVDGRAGEGPRLTVQREREDHLAEPRRS